MLTEQNLAIYMSGIEIYTQHYDFLTSKHVVCENEAECDLYRTLRYTFRFDLQRQYTSNFTLNHIHSFEDLLQFGRYVLQYIYNRKDQYIHDIVDSPTAIEPSLLKDNWPIKQMIMLNHYMYTTASTNNPTQLFQNMFVTGFIHMNVLEKVESLLKKTDLHYFIRTDNNADICWQPEGIHKKEWVVDLVELSIEDLNIERRDLYARLIQLFLNMDL